MLERWGKRMEKGIMGLSSAPRFGKTENHCRYALATLLGIAAAFIVVILTNTSAAAQQVTAGYRDFNYGTTVIPFPTAIKAESKLWWNDGAW
jgi:hypothetical protein